MQEIEKQALGVVSCRLMQSFVICWVFNLLKLLLMQCYRFFTMYRYSNYYLHLLTYPNHDPSCEKAQIT